MDLMTCGPTNLIYSIAKNYPLTYVDYAKDLYCKGEARLGSYHVKPSKKCRNYRPNPNLTEENQGYANAADWVTIASLRDSANTVFNVGQR